MKLHVLQGRKNTGKTTTLNYLINELDSRYPNTMKVLALGGKGDINDKKVIFDDVKGLKIGIETYGDPDSRLLESLEYFATQGCDIIFCACSVEEDKEENDKTILDKVKDFAKKYSCTLIPTKQIGMDAVAHTMIQKAGL